MMTPQQIEAQITLYAEWLGVILANYEIAGIERQIAPASAEQEAL